MNNVTATGTDDAVENHIHESNGSWSCGGSTRGCSPNKENKHAQQQLEIVRARVGSSTRSARVKIQQPLPAATAHASSKN
jgi:hypothetical protein